MKRKYFLRIDDTSRKVVKLKPDPSSQAPPRAKLPASSFFSSCSSPQRSFLFLGIGGQRVFIDKNGAAEVDLTLLDTRWEYTSKPFHDRLRHVNFKFARGHASPKETINSGESHRVSDRGSSSTTSFFSSPS